MPKIAIKVGLPVVICALLVIIFICLGAADSVLSFDWQTSERLLLSAADAKKAGNITVSAARCAHCICGEREPRQQRETSPVF